LVSVHLGVHTCVQCLSKLWTPCGLSINNPATQRHIALLHFLIARFKMSLMLGKHSIGRCFKGQWHWYNRTASIRPSSTTRRYDACTNRPFVRTRASGDDEPTAIGMTTEDAYKILGVTGAATFDDILGAKNKMLAAVDGDQEKTMEVSTCCCQA
jgi:hypothetical protein